MALTATEIKHGYMGTLRVWKWVLTDGETGHYIIVPDKADVSIQAYGTWGGATLTVEGNLIPDSEINKYFAAKNDEGSAISLTVDGGAFVVQNYYKMRPKVTGGSGSSITIYIMLK